MKPLGRKKIEKVLRESMDRIEGEWVLVGGSLLVVQGFSDRSTVDIDLVGLSNPTQSAALELMKVAEANGIPIEAVNQAASYFVLRIENVRDHLVPWISGKKGRLYEPDLYLYVSTKIGRLSETDLSDSIAWIRARKPYASRERILETLERVESEIAAASDPERRKRLEKIRVALKP
jgi:hypothetical protein